MLSTPRRRRPLRTNNQLSGGEFTVSGTCGRQPIIRMRIPGSCRPNSSMACRPMTHNIAESLLSAGGSAQGQSSIQSITAFTMTSISRNVQAFSIDFRADPDSSRILRVKVRAATARQATLQQPLRLRTIAPVGSINWTPQGTFGGASINDCTVSGFGALCTEIGRYAGPEHQLRKPRPTAPPTPTAGIRMPLI